MARRPKENIDTELFESSPDELNEVLAGLPSQDTIINLWRLLPQGAPAYVAEFSPSDFSLEAVKNTYGGGKFKIVAKNNGDVRTSIFSIDGEPLTAVKPVYKKYVGGKLIFAKPDDADVIVTDNARDLRRATESERGETNVMLLMLNEIRALRESIQKPADSQKEWLEQMLMYKNLFAPQQNPIQDFPKIAMDLIKQGMDVAGAAENGGSPWMMILDKIMPTIQDVLKVVSVQQAKVAQVGNNHPTNELPNQPKIQAPLTGFDAIAQDLQNYLPTFIRAASIGTDPAILIDMTMPNIQSGEQANAVIHWLESDAWLSDLVKLHPAISAQAAWWNDYRNGLLDQLKNPQETDQDDIN